MDCVDVIITCYNSSKYLDGTLNGIFGQTYKNLKIYAINDCSVDDTDRILERYKDKINIINNKNNMGQYRSLNKGIKVSYSKYIAFLDHDDIWDRDKIEKQVEIMEKYPDVGLVYTNGTVINEKNQPIYELYRDHLVNNRKERILLCCYIKTPSQVLVRRNIIEELKGFNTDYRIASDHDLWIRIKENSDFYYIPEKLTSYRYHQSQQSNRSAEIMWNEGFQVLNEACKRDETYNAWYKKRKAVLYYRLGELSLKERRIYNCIYYWSKSALNDPVRALKLGLNPLSFPRLFPRHHPPT